MYVYTYICLVYNVFLSPRGNKTPPQIQNLFGESISLWPCWPWDWSPVEKTATSVAESMESLSRFVFLFSFFFFLRWRFWPSPKNFDTREWMHSISLSIPSLFFVWHSRSLECQNMTGLETKDMPLVIKLRQTSARQWDPGPFHHSLVEHDPPLYW